MHPKSVHFILAVVSLATSATAASTTSGSTSSMRQPLSYAPLPDDVYVAPVPNSTVTLLNFIRSRPELSTLAQVVEGPAGFVQAFDTNPTWSFTFFAPSNAAFENLGTYYETFAATRKGKWWIGNQLKNHYVPNSQLKSGDFNTSLTRIQSSTFQWISTQVVDGTLTLNEVASVTEADIPITSGVIHIIDRVLDPAAQIYNADLPRVSQGFIPGSCSDPTLPYC